MLKQKMKIVGHAMRDGCGNFMYQYVFTVLDTPKVIIHPLGIGPDREMEQMATPILTNYFGGNLWLFRNTIVDVESSASAITPDSKEELLLRIKHFVLKHEKSLSKIKREVAAFENIERVPSARRERIPEDVRLFVWQRDEGKCVKCGSKERLEYDHIIPIAEGGANTARNLQLLCELCNRTKGKNIE